MELEDFPGLEGFKNREKQPFSPDLHLKTAIRSYARSFLLAEILQTGEVSTYQAAQNFRELRKIIHLIHEEVDIGSENIYYKLFDPAYVVHSQRGQLKADVEASVELSKDVMMEAIQELLEGVGTDPQIRTFKRKLREYVFPRTLIPLYQLRIIWETIRDHMKDRQMDRQIAFRRIDDDVTSYKLFVNGDYCLVLLDGKTWVLDYSQVLMVSDTVTTRYLSLLHCDLSRHLQLQFMPTPSHLQKLYNWGDHILADFGNDAYAIIKQLEPVCISVFLNKWETLPVCTEYFSKLLDQADTDRAKEELRKLFAILNNESGHKNVLFELFGCYRHFGHPTVDEIGGIQALRTNTREVIQINQPIMNRIVGAHNRMFILAFIGKQRRWPKCHIRDGEMTTENFRKLITKQPLALSEHDLALDIEDWSTLDFEQEFLFDDYKDITMLLSDTAISPYLQNWYTVFNQDLINCQKPETIEESRRVLIEMLTRNDLSCKSIREVVQTWNIPQSWLIVGLHSKERELKEKARLFAMMCIEMRLYFAMTEKNLAENIFPYIPHQTMTWTDAELTKVLLSLTGNHNSESSSTKKRQFVHAIISLDFNKFNQKWRYASTTGIFKVYDQLFGTPGLYDFSHIFFQNAMFYLSSFDCPPDFLRKKTRDEERTHVPPPIPEESDTTWLGQAGGIEGLRQKGWTAIIVSALVLNQHETGIHSQIIGQGDNQVMVVSIPIPDPNMSPAQYIEDHPNQVTATLNAFMKNLEKITAGCGMDLKLEESWISTRLMNYGKEIIFDGSFSSHSIKKMGRAYQETSDIMPTLQNRVASIGTAAQSAAMKGLDCISPYFIHLLETQLMIRKESHYGTTTRGSLRVILRDERVQMDNDLMVTCLMVPNFCGGFPLMPFPSMLYRGHPDQITLGLHWLKRLSKRFIQAKRIFDLICLGHFIDDRPDPVQLIQDPQSVNFKRPRQSYNVVKEVLVRNLREKTRNKMILDMMNACSEETLRSHAEYLFSVEPLNPRVLNELLRLSPDGAMLSFLSTFTDMRTMKQLMPPSDSHVLIQAMETADQMLFRHVVRIHKMIQNEDYFRNFESQVNGVDTKIWLQEFQQCVTEVAQVLRNQSWGKEIFGVTTPHPSEQTKIIKLDQGECDPTICTGEEFILFVVLDKGRDSGMPEECFKRGPMRHYLGSGTAEKRSGPVLKYPKSEKPLGAGCQLFRARDWSTVREVDNTLWDYITDLMKSRTDVSESVLLLIAGANYGGSIQHRFSDVTSKHESRPCIRPNIHSRVIITSDQLGKYARGKDNYPIIFQACFLQALNKIHHLLLYFPEEVQQGPISFHMHFSCVGCTQVIVENPLRTSEKYPKPPILKDCPLVFSSVTRDLSNIPLNCLGSVPSISPNPLHQRARQRCADASAFVILGELHASTIPLLSSSLRYEHRDGTLACLTVGFFCKIGLKNFINSLVKVWICDNLPYIVRVMGEIRGSFEDACGFLLASYPDHVWNILKPFLCVKEVQEEARLDLHLLSTSTDLFISGKGLGNAISQCIAREIKELGLSTKPQERKRFFKLDLLCNSPGISMQRAAFIWLNSVFLSGAWTQEEDLFRLVEVGPTLLKASMYDNVMEFGKLVTLTSSIHFRSVDLYFASTSHLPLISKVGAEPWIAPMSIPAKPLNPLPQAPRSDSHSGQLSKKHIHKVMDHIPLVRLINLSGSTTSGERMLLSAKPAQLTPSAHTRSDHQFRLVGQYSTAALKYCHILSKLGIKEYPAAVHLAEGAGGLCRMSHLIFGAKWVLYASLLEVGESLGHRAYDYLPIETSDLPDLVVEGPHTCYRTGGDITSPRTQAELGRIISTNKEQIKIATCDAENPRNITSGTCTQLVASFLNITKATEPGTLLIFKTFCNSPEILEAQVSLWSDNTVRPQIIVPAFSSHEATEVFLVGWSKHFQNLGKGKWISLINKESIKSLASTRRMERNPLEKIPKVIMKTLYEEMNHLGIGYNFYQAIHIFLGYCQDVSEIENNILRSCAMAIEFGNWMMHQRYSTMSKLVRVVDLLPTERLRKHYARKDSVELARFAQVVINAHILRQLIICKCLSSSYFLEEWKFPITHRSTFDYQIHVPSWLSEYGRSFHRIVGYLRMIENLEIDIPLFLQVVPPSNQ